MRKLQRIGKFYTRILMSNVGIFIFTGLLSVLFHEHGWFPNEDIYAISQLIYKVILPSMIAFEGGRRIGGTSGGILAVLAVSGMLLSDTDVGILGAMLEGPLSGLIWKYEETLLEKRSGAGMQMLLRNLCIAFTAGVLAIAGFYLAVPALKMLASVLYQGVDFLVVHRMLPLLSVIIEPAKVMFLNNLVNYTILAPIGMAQVQEAGQSVLFLLEANPGPGLGVLAALYWQKRKLRGELSSAMLAEAVGGIHEVYFPFIWSDLWLIIPLILGGMAGNVCFMMLDAGAQGVVAPGSVITILLLAGNGNVMGKVMLGIVVSTLVTFAGSAAVLQIQKRRRQSTEAENIDLEAGESRDELHTRRIGTIAVICDGGMGSSSMGAALLRRTLAKAGLGDIRVDAFAADLVPAEGIDLLVCQKDFGKTLPEAFRDREMYLMENLVSPQEYERLKEMIQKRNG